MIARATLAFLLAAAVSCAHTPETAAGASQAAPAQPAKGHRVLSDEGVGYTLELPTSDDFRPGGDDDNIVAMGADGTILRLFPEYFAKDATEAGCWERLMTRLPDGITDKPTSAPELAARARIGLDRGTRRIFFAPFTRGPQCIVLVVDGPSESPLLAETASLALSSFRLGKPSKQMASRMALDAGVQLLDQNEQDAPAALARFEEALALDPTLTKAHLGAGLAAFFAGDAYAGKAIEHLEKVLALQNDEAEPTPNGTDLDRLEGAQLKDALMYLGLAYAAKKDYAKATGRLAETVARFPDDPIALYNFACVLALSGDTSEAIVQLRAALVRDPSLSNHARDDKDLTALRPTKEWQQLVGSAPGPSSQR